MVFTSVCLCVCLFFRTISQKPTQLELGIEMSHDESWKFIYFVVNRSKVKVTSHQNIAGVGLCALVSTGFFSFEVSRPDLCIHNHARQSRTRDYAFVIRMRAVPL